MLRFYACWDNTRRPCGDKMPFVLHYYLVDHTMEVREVRLRNDGRDPFPLLVRRMPFPKKARLYLLIAPTVHLCGQKHVCCIVRERGCDTASLPRMCFEVCICTVWLASRLHRPVNSSWRHDRSQREQRTRNIVRVTAHSASSARATLFSCLLTARAAAQAYSVGMRPRSAQSRRGGASMEYYSWRDLAVGLTIVVFGREMLLTDADEFTREWYKEHAGALDADFAPVPVRRSISRLPV